MANPEIQRRMHGIVRRSGIEPKRVLEVGGYVGPKSLLHSKVLRRAERWCINLVEQPDGTGIRHVVGNSNDMHMFKDGMFDVVMSCAVQEHDQRFWLSVAEMHRVLAPGGLLVVGVPGFDTLPSDAGQTTSTFRVHTRRDYYRFSRRAVREVFLEGLERVKVVTVLDPPRIIGFGYKPVTRRDRVLGWVRTGARTARRGAGRVRRVVGRRRARSAA